MESRVCQGTVFYYTCGCRTKELVYLCSTVNCEHEKLDLLIGGLPFACETYLGLSEACRVEDRARKEFVREADTADRLQNLITLPGCTKADINTILPPFAGSQWDDAIRVLYQKSQAFRGIKFSPRRAAAPDANGTLGAEELKKKPVGQPFRLNPKVKQFRPVIARSQPLLQNPVTIDVRTDKVLPPGNEVGEVSEEVSREVSEEVNESVSEEVSREASEEVNESVSEEVSEEVMTGTVSESIVENDAKDNAEDKVEDPLEKWFIEILAREQDKLNIESESDILNSPRVSSVSDIDSLSLDVSEASPILQEESQEETRHVPPPIEVDGASTQRDDPYDDLYDDDDSLHPPNTPIEDKLTAEMIDFELENELDLQAVREKFNQRFQEFNKPQRRSVIGRVFSYFRG